MIGAASAVNNRIGLKSSKGGGGKSHSHPRGIPCTTHLGMILATVTSRGVGGSCQEGRQHSAFLLFLRLWLQLAVPPAADTGAGRHWAQVAAAHPWGLQSPCQQSPSHANSSHAVPVEVLIPYQQFPFRAGGSPNLFQQCPSHATSPHPWLVAVSIPCQQCPSHASECPHPTLAPFLEDLMPVIKNGPS